MYNFLVTGLTRNLTVSAKFQKGTESFEIISGVLGLKGPYRIWADFGPTPSRLKSWLSLESLCPKDVRTLDFLKKIREQTLK